jgi:hypothetical protein
MGGADGAAVEAALATVRRVLDGLTASGQHRPAFDIARAQFSASVRASWPSNLSAVAHAIDRALADTGVTIPQQDRQALEEAATVLRSVPHP